MAKIVLVLAWVIILFGCTPDNTKRDNNNEEIIRLNNKISFLQTQIDSLHEYNKNTIALSPKKYAIFTPSSKGFSIIHADVGNFLVSLDSLNKYANGYRATFSIGNPNFVTFNGVKVKVEWGETYTNDKNFNHWMSSLKSEEIAINKPLLPGVWNKISIVLSPATANETGLITLSLITSQIFLNLDYRQNTD